MLLTKRITAVAMAVLLLLSLTACGGNEDNPVSGVESSSPTGGNNATTSTTAGDTSDTTTGTGSGDATGTASTTSRPSGSGASSTTTTTKKVDTNPGTQTIDRNVAIKKGTKAVEEGLNIKGKKVKYAIGLALTDRQKRQNAAFCSKYGCTIETTLLGYQNYVQLLSTKVASGEKYDILQLESLRFPSIVISNFCEPLENVISTADFWTGGALTKGGFNDDLTQSFAWNGHLYAVVGVRGEFSPYINVLYYNKKIFEEAGAEDPRELYEKGKWDFAALERVGKQIVKGSDATLTNTYFLRKLPSWNAASYIDMSDISKPKAGLTSTASINAYNYIQTLTAGNDPIVSLYDGSNETPSTFMSGKIAMWAGASFDLFENYSLGEEVSKSNAFSKNLDNLGMVPHPYGPDNKDKAYAAAAWLYGIAAGVGTSDPRIAMAYAKFSTTYNSVNLSKYKWSSEDQAVIDKLSTGKLICNKASFSDGSNIDYKILENMQWRIFEGGDVAQLTASCNAQVQNCIDVMLAQQ